MKIYNHHSKVRSRWLRKPIASQPLRRWLVDDASLTARLQARYADFYVRPTLEQDIRPILDETVLLHEKASKRAYVREVLLYGNQQPVVFAHSVLPHKSLRGSWYLLGKLGNRPLGAALFKNQRVVRTPLSYKKLSQNHTLYKKAVKHLPKHPACLWARRSIFSLGCAHILVTEVFLPAINHE